jgi:hypothetical protein
MPDEEIAFQLMRLYRTLRGPADVTVKEAARREIDMLLRHIDARRARPVPGDDRRNRLQLQP